MTWHCCSTTHGKTRRSIKKEGKALSALVVEICEELFGVTDDHTLEDLYAKHRGVKVDLDNLENDPDFQSFKEAFAADIEALFAEHGGPGDDDSQSNDSPGSAKEEAAHKSRKATAKEMRQAAEEARLKQSVRDVFRKPASVLHPDRETDPAERHRKNALMQRANVAYAADDLLGLLELQFEIAQVDEGSLDLQGEEQIKQYNKLLTRQLKATSNNRTLP